MFTRRSVAVWDVYQSIPPAGTLAWIGLIVRFDIWLGRIPRPPLLMLRAPLITTSHGPVPRPPTTVPLATCAWMTLLVVAVAGVTDGSPYVPGRKKNCGLPPAGGAAWSAALIELTDIEGSKIVTLAPNGLAGGVATGVGAVVHGFVAAAAGEAPPPSRAGRAHPTTSALRTRRDPSTSEARFRTSLNPM